MNRQFIRTKIITELRAGHLGMAMKLVDDNAIEIDDELRGEAVEACIGSLKRHFHWMIPLFVQKFGVKADPKLSQFAAKIITLALQHGQPLIADSIARTFGIELDGNIKMIIESARANLIRSVREADAIVMMGGGGEYNFELE